jgi:hypothetical protein
MAGDWIKMNKSLPRDPRVVRISSALKADRLRTIGGLLSAWCLADEQTEDGKLDAYTPELLDELVGLPGIAVAMESVGWLVIGDGFLEFPRFDEHNGQSAKRRAQDSYRKMSARKADICPQTKRTKSGLEKRRIEKRRIGDEEESPPPPPKILDFETKPDATPNPNRVATFDEVTAFARSQPMPISEECCEAFFDRMEAEGWVTPRGLPLADWRARFRSWATNWTNNANGRKAAAK